MDNLNWFINQLSFFENEIWYVSQHSRKLQEYRDKLRVKWSDNASKELNKRFFNPHEHDITKMLSQFKAERLSLIEMHSYATDAYELSEKIFEDSMKIPGIIEYVKDDIRRAHNQLDSSIENFSKSKEILPMIYELIDRANALEDEWKSIINQ